MPSPTDPPTAAERQAMRERHVPVVAGDGPNAGQPRYCVRCLHGKYPCPTVRLLDALYATEKERDEARRVLSGLYAVAECAVFDNGGSFGKCTGREGGDCVTCDALSEAQAFLLPQPDAPAATAEVRSERTNRNIGWDAVERVSGPAAMGHCCFSGCIPCPSCGQCLRAGIAASHASCGQPPAATAETCTCVHPFFPHGSDGSTCGMCGKPYVSRFTNAEIAVALAQRRRASGQPGVDARIFLGLDDEAPQPTARTCGLCGRPATGSASIDAVPYCHGDYDREPTCYMRVAWSACEHTEHIGEGARRFGRTRGPLGSMTISCPVPPSPAARRVTASGSWLAGTASIAGFCGECGLAAGSAGCAHGDGAV